MQNFAVGVGWDECCNIHCTWTHVWCYAKVGAGVGWDWMWKHSLHMNTCLMLPNSCGWGGVGWDVITAFLARANMFNATQLLRFLLGCSRPCAWTHVWCYVTALRMNTCLMLRNWCVSCWYVQVPCTWTHVWCYPTAAFLAGMFTLLAHEHMLNATCSPKNSKFESNRN